MKTPLSIIKYIKFLGFLLPMIMFSQNNNVGVGTTSPLGKFHVDPQKNTLAATPTTIQLKDDFIVKQDGKTGVGLALPITRLDLRNTDNKDTAVGIGNTTQTAAQAGSGAMRYNSGQIQYSNGTEWVTLTDNIPLKTIVAATKDNWSNTANNVFCYSGGFNSNQSTIPNRASCYIQLWTAKLNNTTAGGSFNTATGEFTANRNGIFTATFTFALADANVQALPENSNQVEAIWRQIRKGTEINSVKCANNYSSNSSGPMRLGSSCTANLSLQAGDVIRPEIWMDISSGIGATQASEQRRSFNITNSGTYNNLTIIEH